MVTISVQLTNNQQRREECLLCCLRVSQTNEWMTWKFIIKIRGQRLSRERWALLLPGLSRRTCWGVRTRICVKKYVQEYIHTRNESKMRTLSQNCRAAAVAPSKAQGRYFVQNLVLPILILDIRCLEIDFFRISGTNQDGRVPSTKRYTIANLSTGKTFPMIPPLLLSALTTRRVPGRSNQASK